MNAPITNTKGAQANPCGLLSKQQQGEYLGSGAKMKSEPTFAAGPRCDWQVPGGGPTIDVTWYTANKHGLTDIYAGKGKYDVFKPMTVDGYPAVTTQLTAGEADSSCEVIVGVTDKLAVGALVGVGYDKRGKLDPCKDAAKPVAKLVLGNIKKQAGS